MKEKDKIFIIVYLNVGEIPADDVYEYASDAMKAMMPKNDDGTVSITLVPVRESETRIECINPVLLTEEKYKEVENTVEKFKIAFDEFLKNEKSRTE